MNSRVFLATLIALSAMSAFADELSFGHDSLPQTSFFTQLGIGYQVQTGNFGFTQCVKGELSDEVIKVESQPFSHPEIIENPEKNEVKVVYSAESSYRRIFKLKSDGKMISFSNPNKEAVCGTHYASEVQVGAKIYISKTYRIASDERAKLISILKSRLTDLMSFRQIDLSKDGFQSIWGANLSMGGLGQTPELQQKMGSCFWLGEDCDGFIAKAYEDAKALDKTYPAERIAHMAISGLDNSSSDVGFPLVYKVQSYRK